MKSAAQLGLITAIAAVGGLGNWLADGRPSGIPADDYTPPKSANLGPNEVTLSQVENEDGVLWIDARHPDLWSDNGLPESISISLSSPTPLGAQIEKHATALYEAKMLVIYCDSATCHASYLLAERLRNDYSGLVPEKIVTLHGGFTALQAAGRLK